LMFEYLVGIILATSTLSIEQGAGYDYTSHS
jgi:hypothetical protein